MSPRDPYNIDSQPGWRGYRILRPGLGMYHDVKRRLPYYWSDITDAWTYRTFAGTVRIYFVNVLPALAFILDMNRRTGGFYGVNEALFSSAFACMVFSLIGAQPLTIVGITGLISLFNYTIFDIIKRYDTIKGVELLIGEFESYGPRVGYAGVAIALLFFFTVYVLELVRQGTWFKPWVRNILGDYAYPLATILWTGFAHFPGQMKETNVPKLPHTRAFYPTVDRDWLIDFWNLDVKWVFVALPIGFLMMLLFYYDHAPVHTDSMTEYRSKLKVIKTHDGHEIYEQETIAERVVEQRVSHFLMGLAIIGTMTGPLLDLYNLIPRALFGGVFFVVGWSGLEGNGIMKKILYLIREERFVQPDEPLRQVPNQKILLYLFWQIFGITATVGVSQTIAGIGFPVLIIALIPLRWKILPKMFKPEELSIMDHLTADSDIVLASMGGKPTMPEDRIEHDEVERNTPKSSDRDGSKDVSSEKLSTAERGEASEGLRARGNVVKEPDEYRGYGM
ncbi:uncharacterized protein KY384_006759 [Bacidia gigantensis]|uniref:uncharacterized protein n=1 Tax=Bacidia gigantensis TaxID=2732470 RepID=UPI001D051725|nr:uncharacterized protein KY384_006759 [Bacidia gigantensis]KAG8527843.1 hypothetical protein KY384_006759 [Bacidia gigantensis]